MNGDERRVPTRRELRAREAEPARRPRGGRPDAGRIAPWRVVVGVIGELMLTAGVLVLLFIGWKLWVNDASVDRQQEQAAGELAQQWADQTGDGSTESTAEPDDPSVTPQGHDQFGVMYVQRLGDTWQRPIARGVEKKEVLDKMGLGWYPTTQLQGQVGNFAVAGHRGGYGASLRYVDSLTVGDHIVVETADGWYDYRYRNSEYVMDSAVDVLDPVPRQTTAPDARLLTLTTCNPYPFTNGERLISYAVLDRFTPRAAGRPAVLDYLQ
ncbi:class E sortase [Pseudoclavibacter caeni]|uniref:class E sortase n=1 Tax=Pseudoclavibacter caeni TaxID=908846 RepID=UPI0017B16EAD|nr:class E sortase [Pseudoclavibacter caeni]NYJ96426.1 sortase A [Pseudoclavibacter caeni]